LIFRAAFSRRFSSASVRGYRAPPLPGGRAVSHGRGGRLGGLVVRRPRVAAAAASVSYRRRGVVAAVCRVRVLPVCRRERRVNI